MATRSSTPGLFDAVNLPDGFEYRAEFLTADEERTLADHIAQIEFSTFEMRGVVARRRVAFFGATYERGDSPSPPIPEFLSALRGRLAAWVRIDAQDFSMALINEY